jgi:hypothetical protein
VAVRTAVDEARDRRAQGAVVTRYRACWKVDNSANVDSAP